MKQTFEDETHADIRESLDLDSQGIAAHEAYDVWSKLNGTRTPRQEVMAGNPAPERLAFDGQVNYRTTEVKEDTLDFARRLLSDPSLRSSL